MSARELRALWHLFSLCFCVNRVIFMQVCCLCNECQENWWHLRPSTFASISLFFWVAILEISVPPLLAGKRRRYPLSLVTQDSKRGSIWKSSQFQFWTVRHGTNLVYAWCALGAFHYSPFPPPLCLVYWFLVKWLFIWNKKQFCRFIAIVWYSYRLFLCSYTGSVIDAFSLLDYRHYR